MEFIRNYSILLLLLQLSFGNANESNECADFPSEVYNIKAQKDTSARIYDGTKANGPLPYQVMLLVNGNLCGGTLISPNHILTARHCLVDLISYFKVPSENVTIRVGSNDRNAKEGFHTANEIYVYQPNDIFIEEPIAKILLKMIKNDIGIIHVDKPIEFNEKVKPACLPKNEITFGTTCYVSGWGSTKHVINGSESIVTEMPEELMTASLNIFNKSECYQEMLKQNESLTSDVFESYYKELFPEGICASNQPKSACPGDSGGPFICEENGKAIISGIVSGGIDINFDDKKLRCGDLPSYFTKVHYYMEFIDCVLEGENDECECQLRQDKVIGINRKCFDYSSPPPSGNSTAVLANWKPFIFQLLFLMLTRNFL